MATRAEVIAEASKCAPLMSQAGQERSNIRDVWYDDFGDGSKRGNIRLPTEAQRTQS